MRRTAYNGESELCHIIFSVLKNLCVHSVDRTVATFEIDEKLSYSARLWDLERNILLPVDINMAYFQSNPSFPCCNSWFRILFSGVKNSLFAKYCVLCNPIFSDLIMLFCKYCERKFSYPSLWSFRQNKSIVRLLQYGVSS